MDCEDWNKLHSQRRFCPVYPDSNVVVWSLRNFSSKNGGNINFLDLGTGAGRHAIFLAREGFSTWACDFSKVGLERLDARTKIAGVTVRTDCCEADNLGYEDNFFHGVIVFGVYYYISYERFIRAVGELKRVLTPGGRALVVMRTDKDSRRNGAKQVGKYTFQLPDLSEVAPFNAESGTQMLFLDEKAVIETFACFSELDLDRVTVTRNGRQFTNDDWFIHLRK